MITEKRQICNTWQTEDDVYATWWKLYIQRWNYLLPEIPLYSNEYYDLYNAQIGGVQEHPTNPYWAPASALIDWTSAKEDNSIILGNATDLSGKFRYANFGANNPGAADLDVQGLIVGLETVVASKEGGYVWSDTVVAEHSALNEEAIASFARRSIVALRRRVRVWPMEVGAENEAEGAMRGSWRAVFTAQSSHRGCHMTPACSSGGWAQESLSRCPPLLQSLFRASPG